MSSHLSDDALNNDLIVWNVTLVLDILSNGFDNLFRPVLGVGVVVLIIGKHALDDVLNNVLDLRWVKPGRQ